MGIERSQLWISHWFKNYSGKMKIWVQEHADKEGLEPDRPTLYIRDIPNHGAIE